MTKKNFMLLVLTVVGGLLFALGMCMCLMPEWNAFKPGVVVTALGAVTLLVIGLVRWIMAGKPVAFLKKALNDMKESAKAQHEVDKAKFAAAKAESRARWEEAKAMGRPETHKAMMQAQRDKQIKEAIRRKADAEARISKAQR